MQCNVCTDTGPPVLSSIQEDKVMYSQSPYNRVRAIAVSNRLPKTVVKLVKRFDKQFVYKQTDRHTQTDRQTDKQNQVKI